LAYWLAIAPLALSIAAVSAAITQPEITQDSKSITLPADILFAFDSADIRSAASSSLSQAAEVIRTKRVSHIGLLATKAVGQRLLDDTCQQRTGRHEEDGCWPSFEDEFLRQIAPLSSAIVSFSSDGGSLIAGLQIGETIRLKNFSTLVPEGAHCASSCALAWLGGTR
jgi:hypothetical protein